MAENEVLATIVVPVYNAEKYIEKCINSLLNQNYLSYEIILVNDGSTDMTYNILSKYKDVEKIKIINKSNGGTSSAKNAGMHHALGKYIVFVDSDDFVSENYLQNTVGEAKKNDTELVVTGMEIIYPKTNEQIVSLPIYSENKCNDCLGEVLFSLGYSGLLSVDVGKAYKREIILQNNILFDEKLTTGEDLVFNCKYLMKITSAISIPVADYYYVRRDVTSLVNKFNPDMFAISVCCLNSVNELYDSQSLCQDKSNEIKANYFVDFMSNCIHILFRKECHYSGHQKRKKIKDILAYSRRTGLFYNTSRQGIICKLFLLNIKFNSPVLTYYLYSVIFFIRNNFSTAYYKFRKYFINKSRR